MEFNEFKVGDLIVREDGLYDKGKIVDIIVKIDDSGDLWTGPYKRWTGGLCHGPNHIRHATQAERIEFYSKYPKKHPLYNVEHGNMSGWRYLEKDEDVIEGDKYFSDCFNIWKESSNWRLNQGQTYHLVYRRRVDSTINNEENNNLKIPEGFIKWNGGKCPVSKDDKIEVIFRSGSSACCDTENPTTLRWKHLGYAGDIMAYRVIPQKPVPGSWVKVNGQKKWYCGPSQYTEKGYVEDFGAVDYKNIFPWKEPEVSTAKVTLHSGEWEVKQVGDNKPEIKKVSE